MNTPSSQVPATQEITHYENFPVASWLCPPELRAPISALYHFARTADDIADEGSASAEERLADLNNYRMALVQACTSSDHAGLWPHVFQPLSWAIREYALPIPLLHDLLDAFVQDVEKTRDGTGYKNETELLDYCRHSANPVGRLLLHLYDIADPLALERSDAICTALQLINFWQDPSRDLPRGRNYFSQESMERWGVHWGDLMQQKQTPAATQMIAACAHSARASMQFGIPLVHQIPGRAGWELRLVVQGGLRILDKIAGMGFATLNARPALRWWDYPLIALRALRM
jgi:squalene synthase HpnC